MSNKFTKQAQAALNLAKAAAVDFELGIYWHQNMLLAGHSQWKQRELQAG